MRQMVNVKEVRFGDGSPKICIPIVERTSKEIKRAADALANVEFDVVELRIDFFEEAVKPQKVIEVLESIRDLVKQPILFTFRTKEEGGEASILKEEYSNLYQSVMDCGLVDMVDVELCLGDEFVRKLAAYAKDRGITVVMSNHDFMKTPSKEEIIRRLVHMQQLGADLPKIAVMPKDKRDVLTLMEATLEMSEKHNETPVITMSMGKLGVLSRIAGEFTGSAMTFATNGKVSAPGQIPAGEMKQMLSILQ